MSDVETCSLCDGDLGFGQTFIIVTVTDPVNGVRVRNHLHLECARRVKEVCP